MSPLLLLDTGFRLLASGQLLLTALVVARSAAPRPIRAVTAALLLCVIAYLANVAPALDVPRSPLWPLVNLASLSTPLMLWLFTHRIFERPIDRRLALGAVAITFFCWSSFVIERFWLHQQAMIPNIAQHLLALVLALHALYLAAVERGDDLIEKRRVFRIGFVVVIGLQTVGIIVSEMFFGFRGSAIGILLFQSGTTFVAVMAFGAVMLSGNAELLFDAQAAPAPRPELSPAEHVLKQKLDAAMAAGAYREPGLSIGGLAERLGTPEHRLRALINQRLGYRNFSGFLNIHRVADARAWLGDPDKVALPVLTIAMDLGYGSLAPFNRAFREATGQTPTDYRRAAILTPENP